ncbi:Cysteine-rich protein [Spironucleus salmonicida]|uniref:Cysteine-rich protein n=1 Tax=Spironucleus salmonicida TaxID=348837 RepID=A0A9P8LZV3_9EUKA|nr:Cysteine-rich protein [Spironucleus salmonicida]KAH0577358.1 Cysteine-rich protein [Spironucleus salmonicida]
MKQHAASFCCLWRNSLMDTRYSQSCSEGTCGAAGIVDCAPPLYTFESQHIPLLYPQQSILGENPSPAPLQMEGKCCQEKKECCQSHTEEKKAEGQCCQQKAQEAPKKCCGGGACKQ